MKISKRVSLGAVLLALAYAAGVPAAEPAAEDAAPAAEPPSKARPRPPSRPEASAPAAEPAAPADRRRRPPTAPEASAAAEPSRPAGAAEAPTRPLRRRRTPQPTAPALGAVGYDSEGRQGRIHLVVRGDTLWDISDAYLGTPWVWPSIWKDNQTIHNPHLIRPGDRIWITPSEMRRVSPEEAAALLAGQPAAPEPEAGARRAGCAADPDRRPEPEARNALHVSAQEGVGLVTPDQLEAAGSIVSAVPSRVMLSQGDGVFVGMPRGRHPEGRPVHDLPGPRAGRRSRFGPPAGSPRRHPRLARDRADASRVLARGDPRVLRRDRDRRPSDAAHAGAGGDRHAGEPRRRRRQDQLLRQQAHRDGHLGLRLPEPRRARRARGRKPARGLPRVVPGPERASATSASASRSAWSRRLLVVRGRADDLGRPSSRTPTPSWSWAIGSAGRQRVAARRRASYPGSSPVPGSSRRWSPPGLLDPRPDPADARALRPWLALQRRALLPARSRRRALLREHGDSRARAARERGSAAPRARASSSGRSRPCAVWARVGLPLSSRAYPPRLARYPDAAPLLLVQGDPLALAAPGIAIVGSRAATQHGLALARDFAAALARAGLVVISGLARGIDAAAHAGALAAGGRTVAVQACGPDLRVSGRAPPPREPDRGAGARVTEFPPGTPPRRAALPAAQPADQRPRRGAAGDRSARAERHAGDRRTRGGAGPRRLRAARPGGRGGLRRLEPTAARRSARRARAGGRARRAAPGRSAARAGVASAAGGPRPRRRERVRWALRSSRALERAPAHRDELARRLSRAPQELALEILELELAGRIREERDGRFRVVSPRETREL